jgi:hypothetical protein
VPSASECGAGLLSPYLGLRQFPGFHSGDDALLSPIRRSFCETSSIDETVWSPNKMVHGRWSPVKLGSIVSMVKTPQAIREALARSEINRSRISPEDVSGRKGKKEEEGVSKSDRALPPSGFVFQNLAVVKFTFFVFVFSIFRKKMFLFFKKNIFSFCLKSLIFFNNQIREILPKNFFCSWPVLVGYSVMPVS